MPGESRSPSSLLVSVLSACGVVALAASAAANRGIEIGNLWRGNEGIVQVRLMQLGNYIHAMKSKIMASMLNKSVVQEVNLCE